MAIFGMSMNIIIYMCYSASNLSLLFLVTWMMNNSTEISEDVIAHQGDFGYYSLFITLFFLTPAFIFNILLLVAIIAERTLPRSIRFILSNIIIASEVVISGIAIIMVHDIILSGWMHISPSLPLCHFSYVTLTSGAAARLMFMATFAITVYVLVRQGQAKLHFRLLFPAGILLWFFAIIPNTVLFSTDVLEVEFHEGSGCHRENVRCARFRLHVETVPVNTYRTRITRVSVRCIHGSVYYRICILCHGMYREYGRRLTRK